MREAQILLTCIHPAAHPDEVQALRDTKVMVLPLISRRYANMDLHRYTGRAF